MRQRCYLRIAMDDNWYPRLVAAIEADGRSKRQISEAAGFGPNFVQQMIKQGKVPSADKLQGLLRALGTHQMFYVLTGIEVRPEDEAFLRIALAAPQKVRDRMRDLMLELLEDGQET